MLMERKDFFFFKGVLLISLSSLFPFSSPNQIYNSKLRVFIFVV